MSKAAVTWIVVAVIILAGGAALLANHKSSDSSMNTKNQQQVSQLQHQQMQMNSSSSSSSSSPAATNSVTIENFAFSPANITVKKGTAVTWTNKDSVAHTVTENDGQTGPKSGDLANGQSYSFTFAAAGTYKYHCSIHPDMTGTVTVTD